MSVIYPKRVKTIAKAGSAGISGDATLSQGTNITLVQSGQDISIAAAGGAADGAIFKYREVGTRYHGSGLTSVAASSGVVIVIDQMRAWPFMTSQAITLDRIAIHISSAAAAGNTARLGIYNDNGSLYPGTLLLDAGTVATDSTGIKTITISQALSANTLYWLAGNASVNATTNNSQTYTIPMLLGVAATDFTTFGSMYFVTSTYSTFPDIIGYLNFKYSKYEGNQHQKRAPRVQEIPERKQALFIYNCSI